MADPRDTDPVDRSTPPDRDLSRRSAGPANPWVVIGSIALLVAVVYVVSALI